MYKLIWQCKLFKIFILFYPSWQVLSPFFPLATANPQTGKFLEKIFHYKILWGESIIAQTFIIIIIIILSYNVKNFTSNWWWRSQRTVDLYIWHIIRNLFNLVIWNKQKRLGAEEGNGEKNQQPICA